MQQEKEHPYLLIIVLWPWLIPWRCMCIAPGHSKWLTQSPVYNYKVPA